MASAQQLTILFVSDETDSTRAAISTLKRDGRLLVESADNAFDGGVLVRNAQPELIVLSDALVDLDLRDAVRIIRRSLDTEEVKVICLAPAQLHPSLEADVCLSTHPEASTLVTAIYELLGVEPMK